MNQIYYNDVSASTLEIPINKDVELLKEQQQELIDLQHKLMAENTNTTHRRNNLETELKKLKIDVYLNDSLQSRIKEIEKELKTLNSDVNKDEQIYNLSQAIQKIDEHIQSLEKAEIYDVVELNLIKNIDTELNELQSLIEKIDSQIIKILGLTKASSQFHNNVIRQPLQYLTPYNYQMFDKLNAFIENTQLLVNNYLLNKNKES